MSLRILSHCALYDSIIYADTSCFIFSFFASSEDVFVSSTHVFSVDSSFFPVQLFPSLSAKTPTESVRLIIHAMMMRIKIFTDEKILKL